MQTSNQPTLHSGADRWNGRAVHLFLTVAAITFACYLPFLTPGYGLDPDGWRVVSAAREIWQTGQYRVSRLPGYPLQELLCCLLWQGGPWLVNGVTALMSAIAAGSFALALQTIGHRAPLLTSLAFAFTPMVFINSTNAMDYLWALGLVLAGTACALKSRPVLAGVLVGLATGVRMTSLSFALPLSLFMLNHENPRKQIARLFAFWVVSVLVSVCAFIPVLHRYGLVFLTFSEGARPPLLMILYRASVPLFGLFGVLLLVVCLGSEALLRVTRGRAREMVVSLGPLHKLGCAIAVALVVAIYVRLPAEAGYLIPAIPFSLILLGSVLRRRLFLLACGGLIASPFLVSMTVSDASSKQTFSGIGFYLQLGGHPVFVDVPYGPIISDHLLRKARCRYAEQVVDRIRGLPQPSVVVAGWRIKEVEAAAEEKHASLAAEIVYLLDRAATEQAIACGAHLFFLERQREFNRELVDVDLAQFGGELLEVGG